MPDSMDRVRALLIESAGDGDALGPFVQEMATIFRATHCGFISLPAAHTGLPVISAFSGDPAVARDYAAYYSSINPWRPAIFRQVEGTVATDPELCSVDSFRRTEFYADFGRKYGVVRTLGSVVIRNENEVTFIALDRAESAPEYEAADVRRLAGMVRDVRLTIKLHRANELAGALRSAFDTLPEAMAILRVSGELVSANRAFMSCLGECFSVGRGGVVAALPPFGERFRRAVGRTVSSKDASEMEMAGGWAVSILPQPGDCVVVRVRPTGMVTPPPGKIARVLGLTRAEGRLAEQLLVSRTLVEAAGALGIAVSTAKTQLRSIFAKTGCGSQKELMVLISRRLGNVEY